MQTLFDPVGYLDPRYLEGRAMVPVRDSSTSAERRQARKALTLRLRAYLAWLTTEMGKDADAFFARVMELSKVQEAGALADGDRQTAIGP